MIKFIQWLTVLLLLFLLSCNNKKTTATVATNDSIKKYLEIAKNDTTDFKTRDKYTEKAFNLLDISVNDSVLRNNLSKITSFSAKTNNFIEYKKFSKILFEKSKVSKDTLNLAKFYRYKAYYCKSRNVFDSSFYFYLKAEKLYKRTFNKYELSKIYLFISNLMYTTNDYSNVDFYLTKSKLIYNKYATKHKDIVYEITYQISKGNLSQDLKYYDKAIVNYKNALKLARENDIVGFNNANLVGSSLNNIGNSYLYKKEYSKAIFYFKEGLKQKNIFKEDQLLYAQLLQNLGLCFKNTKYQKDLPELFEKSERIFYGLNAFVEQSNTNLILSNYYYQRENIINAQKYADKALKIARKSQSPYTILNSLRQVGFVNKNKASQCIDEYDKKIDILIDKERIARNQFYNIQLQTNEIAKEKETAIKQKWVLASIITSVLLIVILLFIIYRQKAKQKELSLLQDQQNANEAIYELMINQQESIDIVKNIEKKRIGVELHDNILNKLASTRFNLFELSKKRDDETINKALLHINNIQDIENEIRNISHNLTQDIFIQTHSFKTLISTLLQEQSQLHNINYTLEIETTINWDVISSKIKMQLYRIIQEALHNINKHAQATQATVNIAQEENSISMVIKDNGIGFDNAVAPSGIGIKNMQERIERNDGKFTIQSSIGSGTSIFIVLPFI